MEITINEIDSDIHKELKCQTKNKVLLIACRKKINEIIQNPYHYKHLKYEDRLRVHVGGSFVLTHLEVLANNIPEVWLRFTKEIEKSEKG